MLVEVFKEFTFEASHSLPFLQQPHKCRRLHGHSYHVTVRARIDEKYLAEQNWMVVDYADISEAWRELYETLDHWFLNEIEGLERSTSEMLAIWIYRRMKKKIKEVSSVTVRETATAGSTYPL